MKNTIYTACKVFIIIFSVLIYMQQANAQWVNQVSPSGFNIFSCSFPSALTGYVSGYGNLILKTTNGGTIWSDMSLPGTADNLESIWFLNDNTGFVASTNDTLMMTTNGGGSWIRHFYAPSDPHRIFFINSQTGWCTSSKLFKTTNAGLNWFLLSNEPAEDMYFINENTGWKTTYSAGNSTLLKTTNGGTVWSPIHSTSNFRVLYAVKFINENTGWVSGYREYIAATTNGGTNWTVQRDIGNSNGLYAVEFINQSTGWAAGDQGVLLTTTNGGTLWSQGQLSGSNRLEEIEFINQSTGWVVGGFGKIYKTTNGGIVPVVPLSEIAKGFSLSQNYPNPFNPETKIRFSIPQAEGSSSRVKLSVFDITGKEAALLVNGALTGGVYEASFNASHLASGIYFYKLEVFSAGNISEYSEVKKMILIK